MARSENTRGDSARRLDHPHSPFPRLAPALALALALLAPQGASSQIPPDLDWRTLETEHFQVTFAPGLEPLARHAAARAEAAYPHLAEVVAEPPDGPIRILLTDNSDIPNGFATPFYYNHVVLYARPPIGHLALGFHRDWIDLLLVHELAHVFHQNRAGALGRAVRTVFGRVPSAWPLFPAVFTPEWSIEGLATYVESRLTGAGRAYGSFHEMVVRTAILEDAFAPIDRIEGATPIWPGGNHSYVYGSLFMQELAERFGPDAMAEMVDATAGAVIPTFLYFDRVARKAWGESFVSVYRDWRRELDSTYTVLADSLRAAGLTQPERLTHAGRWALHPRVSPDGRLVSFAAATGRDEPATYLLDASTGEIDRLARRNQDGDLLGPASWLPDGRLLVAQLEFADPYHIFQDLWILDAGGEERRLTRGARLSDPDVHPDGRRAVAVQSADGATRLVLVDVETGELRPLNDYAAGRGWSLPRWSPDGTRLAVTLWGDDGRSDIVVLDTLGAVLRRVTDDAALDGGPAWSPDGRRLFFHSDRTGITNLYAFDPAAEQDRPLQVTNVFTGAFYPAASPDGWLYFAGYHADGFHIERIPLEPERWRPAGPARQEFRTAPVLATSPAADAPVRDYSAWSTLRPRFWLPLYEQTADGGHFFGVLTAGRDLVRRHAYSASLGFATRHSLVEGSLSYRYAGLGNPVLSIGVDRDWDFLARDTLQAGVVEQFRRGDELELAATFRRQRWRSSAALTLGAELAFDRRRLLAPPAGVRFREDADTLDTLTGAFAHVGFANYRVHPFSISRQDGIAVGLTGRVRRDLQPSPRFDGGYDELAPRASAYFGFPVFGFADHVLAARGSALWRRGPGAAPHAIGGASGLPEDILGLVSIGSSSLFLPVRGFPEGVRRGTRAWSASLEYRFPLALVGRGYRLWPAFLDRLAAAVFLDAGDASCDAVAQARFRGCPAEPAAPLLGAGLELAATVNLFYASPLQTRLGLAFPLRGPGDAPRLHFSLGPAF